MNLLISSPLNNIVFETIPSFLIKPTSVDKKTIFVFPHKQVTIDDALLLPCFMTAERVKIRGMTTRPSDEGLFYMDGHLFKNFTMKNNFIYYF